MTMTDLGDGSGGYQLPPPEQIAKSWEQVESLPLGGLLHYGIRFFARSAVAEGRRTRGGGEKV